MALTFDQLRHTGLIRTDNLIDGRWSAGADGARYAVTDPATGSIIAQVADSSAADARAGVGNAQVEQRSHQVDHHDDDHGG
ncbi:hypothetical protein ACQCSJ_13685, partial [Ralstonia pseudosolanacearum]